MTPAAKQLRNARRLRATTVCLMTFCTGWAAFHALHGRWVWSLLATGFALMNGFLIARQSRLIRDLDCLQVPTLTSLPTNGHVRSKNPQKKL